MHPTLDDLLNDPPLVHRGGELVWGLHEDVLRYIDAILPPRAKTLETGCGLSTALFALRSAAHTCIVPSREEVELLRDWGKKHSITFDNVEFIVDFSQNVLPNLKREELDLVLVDGGHGFPIPALDWFYTAPMLKRGGVMVIDDVQIWTGLELQRFLAKERAWQSTRRFTRTRAFRKIDDDHAKDWRFQPYVYGKSRLPIFRSLAASAFDLLRKGQMGTLVQKGRKALRMDQGPSD